MSKVMVFGVFDGIHDGHRSLFSQAREYADHLIVVVAQDAAVISLKNHAPQYPLAVRLAHASEEPGVDKSVPGDSELGAWEVICAHRPDVIALGYDQGELMKSIMGAMKNFEWNPRVVVLRPYKSETEHTSLK